MADEEVDRVPQPVQNNDTSHDAGQESLVRADNCGIRGRCTTDGTDYEESTTESISLGDGDSKSLTATVTDTDENDALDTHPLHVTVVNHNDDPVEGAIVSVVTADGGDEVASGTTDGDGTVLFDVQNGEYDVIVEHEDVTGDTATRTTVEDAEQNVDVMLDTSDRLATGVVKVVDQNGDPVEGEPVTLWPPGTVERSDRDARN